MAKMLVHQSRFVSELLNRYAHVEGLSEVPVSKSLDCSLDPEDPNTAEYRENLSL